MPPLIKCPSGKILNPDTNRCVSRDGKIGKLIISNKIAATKKPSKKKPSNKPVSKKKPSKKPSKKKPIHKPVSKKKPSKKPSDKKKPSKPNVDEINKPIKKFKLKQRNNWENDYKLGERIGKGAYGSVYKGKRLSDNQDVAIKIITIHGKSQMLWNLVVDEISFLMNISCKKSQLGDDCCLLTALDVFYVGKKETVYIITDLINGGDGDKFKSLFAKQLSNDPKQAMVNITKMFYDMAASLDELHKHCMLHRDLKPSNLLYDPKNQKLIISDFGLACFRDTCYKTIAGDNAYADPKLFKKANHSIYGDVYSFGITMFEIITNKIWWGEAYNYTKEDENPNYVTQYMQNIETLKSQFLNTEFVPTGSPAEIMIQAIILMTDPELTSRPSLSSLVNAIKKSDIKLLKHEKSECDFTRTSKKQKKDATK